MSRHKERDPTDIMVTPLDLSALQQGAVDFANKDVDESQGEVKKCVGARCDTYGVVIIGDDLYPICTEGVGYKTPVGDDDDTMLELEFWGRYKTPGQDGESCGIFPFCSQKLNAEEVRGLATGEPVNLAEWIRTFGSRLESNYYGAKAAYEALAQEAVA